MIVIIKHGNYVTIQRFKHKFLSYAWCVLINKIKGYQVEVLEDDGI